jgi:hypothetical protein
VICIYKDIVGDVLPKVRNCWLWFRFILIVSAKLFYNQNSLEHWFLYDNDPKFTSKVVTNWIYNQCVLVIQFPPYSPDLNPMENLWIELEKRVEKYNATTLDGLQDAIAEEWDKTSLDFLKTLSHSMPKRCQAVIDANGQHTMYEK